MTHRISIVVYDDVWEFLRDIPQDQRSRIINDALRAWVRERRRSESIADMDRLRNAAGATAVTTEEVVRWIREGRAA